MLGGVDETQMFAQPPPRRVQGDVPDIQMPTLKAKGGAIADNQLHRFDQPTAAEPLFHLPGHQQPLVDIVMEHPAELAQIGPRKSHGNSLHHGVAHGVGMPQAFPLDNLKGALIGRLGTQRFNGNVHKIPLSPAGLRTGLCYHVTSRLATVKQQDP